MINAKKVGGSVTRTYKPSAALMVAGTYRAWVDGIYQPASRIVPVAFKHTIKCRPVSNPLQLAYL